MEKDLIKSKLYNKIISEKNIFNAIFCLESYVFEKGLLDTKQPVCDSTGEIFSENDLVLYYALSDKYNIALIDHVIDACKGKLEGLFTNPDNLFEVDVYFRLKSLEDNGVLKFRPLHSARLIDLICMVSILSCLMYDDTDKRNLSDLSKLVPHNFYGNIPSTNVQYLFQRWQSKYKEYTENVIEHCRAYQNNHRYLTEVSLDIKNFFPSIAPKILYDYITEKLSSTYTDYDEYVLKLAVSKLLFFKLNKEHIEPWQYEYYLKGYKPSKDGLYMNCGIAQGLPQSYFFGNLCMIEVKKILMEDDCFNGDAYFYVDDSVIYVQSELQPVEFENKIKTLNRKLEDFCNKRIGANSDINKIVPPLYLNFHSELLYQIKFHEDTKSTFCHIDEADNHLDGFENLARETSMSSNLSWNLDEIDDTVSLRKLEAIDKVIEKELERIEGDNKINENEKAELQGKDASRLKMLRRFKKFFLYRNKLLKIKTEGGPKPEFYEDFKKRFLDKSKNLKEWFDQFNEDIFMSEYRLLLQMETREEAQNIYNDIITFEREALDFVGINQENRYKSLFYAKDVECSLRMKILTYDCYASLIRWVNENFKGSKNLNQTNQFDKFTTFLGVKEIVEGDKNDENKKGKDVKKKKIIAFNNILKNGFEERAYSCFIAKNSFEFQRRILNVYFSEIIGVLPSDALSFTKVNSRRLYYAELRVLAQLRNKDFDLNEFKIFIQNINADDVSNRMSIDMGLLEVLSTFIIHVRKPEWVDALILTHRVTKGLWYNGSKFLNSYTLHNEEHAVTLINTSLHIIKTIDYFALKDVDYYILFLACYLHDISMVIHPDLYMMISSNSKSLALISEQMLKMQEEVMKFHFIDKDDNKNSRLKASGKFLIEVFNAVYGYFENEVREHHATDSAKFIRVKSKTLLNHLSPTLIDYVAKVSDSHGYNTLDVYGLKSRAKDEIVSLKYLMILIRLADLLDVANDRVNYHLLRQNLKHMSLTSKFHWISHLITDKIELSAEYETDEDKKLYEKPITEKLNLNLYLNVKYLFSDEKNKKCSCCQCELKEDHIAISITNSSKMKETCNQVRCTFLCRWMMKKHEWLIPELKALNDYLYSVNNSLIRTEVIFNINYRNDMTLEADMFDDVQEYLQE